MNREYKGTILYVEDGSRMLEDANGNLLKKVYVSMSEGIMNIESCLSQVESEDMNYDLNRQLQDYYRMAGLCKEELQRQGESLGSIAHNLRGNIQQSAISFQYKSYVANRKENDTDQIIARNIVDDIRRRVDCVRKFADNSSSEAVNSIAMEIMEEEENHMDWMKSYVR